MTVCKRYMKRFNAASSSPKAGKPKEKPGARKRHSPALQAWFSRRNSCQCSSELSVSCAAKAGFRFVKTDIAAGFSQPILSTFELYFSQMKVVWFRRGACRKIFKMQRKNSSVGVAPADDHRLTVRDTISSADQSETKVIESHRIFENQPHNIRCVSVASTPDRRKFSGAIG